ncbi:energy transducer TonB [Massilia sp. IC2-477]|uniref:energy transducer TonB n=1 Tax=unclassified Massilia TaxID=2609279 RepID=UPI001D12FDB8|nr:MULTISPECIES: energy transducer TonB [unclassified Massilia]MCC2958430.1 energy transducer TonB [Massilia sp. IC2-477]MCC2974714.1 energy transducer TonB [Massilia sp. IC2-476]
MHFTQLNDGTGGKAGKFALVAGLHALVALGVVNMMNAKTFTLPKLLDDVTVWVQPQVPPPPPAQPPTPQTKAVKPPIVVPKTEVEVPPPPVEQQVQATTEAEPVPEQSQPSNTDAPPAEPATSNSNPGQMFSAVLANADGCAKPDYPINAARNGDTGTVTLALLVGTDGRVQDAKVQKSSGHRELDRAALNALSLCQFKPAMSNGAAQAGWGQIAYVWTLE